LWNSFNIYYIGVYGCFLQKTLPAFRCSAPFENSEVKMSCKFTTENGDGNMWLVYTIVNKLPIQKICASSISINGNKRIMHKDITLKPNKKYDFEFIVPYPKKNSIGSLSAFCQ